MGYVSVNEEIDADLRQLSNEQRAALIEAKALGRNQSGQWVIDLERTNQVLSGGAPPQANQDPPQQASQPQQGGGEG
ncbi:MAG: hypothetical protein K9G62_09095, partial [Alphaproteobacteria bacterium]|nr:hypothetical protein [Alphaproteobacteria bacterium]